MDKRLEIEKYLDKNSIFNAVNFYNEPNELMIILNIVISRKRWDNIDTVMTKFPYTEEYDDLKINIINLYGCFFKEYDLKNLIRCIFNDNSKLEIFNKNISNFSDTISVRQIVNSFNSDDLKCDLFARYQCYFDGEGFSDYLRKLKSDETRKSEFNKYVKQYDSIRLDWIAASFSNDKDRMEFYEDNFSYANLEDLSFFISNLSKDESKMDFLDKYSKYIERGKMWFITSSLKKLEIKKDILKRYADKMESREIKELLNSISDINLRFKLLETVVDMISSYDLLDLIEKIPNVLERINIFKKYINRFDSGNFLSMYICLDDKYKETFLDEYIDYFTGHSLFRIYSIEDWINDKEDKNLNKYINYFNPLCLSTVIVDFCKFGKFHGRSSDINNLANQFIKKAKNKKNLRTIYNAIAITDSEYYVNNLLKNENEIFSDEEQKICNMLFKQNHYLYSSFIFELLDIKELRNNLPLLTKLSKYKYVAQKICTLYNKNINKSKVLFMILDYIFQQDINPDKFSINIIDEISNYKYDQLFSNLDVNIIEQDILITLIFKLLKVKNIYDEESNYKIDVDINTFDDLKNYTSNLDKKIDETFNSSEEIDKLKNCIFNKYYGIDYSVAKKIIETYGVSLDKLGSTSEIDYIRKIKYILEIETEEELRKYYSMAEKMDIEEMIFIDQKIKKVFNNKISSSLLKVSDLKPISYYECGNKKIPVYVPQENFYLLVNSTVAYKRIKTYIENYNEFWNFNERTDNHGISCSLISNQNLCSTAPLDDVLFGFDGFSDKSIQLMNVIDIASNSNEFYFSALNNSQFMISQDLIDNTRYDHNELVLERLELRKDKQNKYLNIQPSYVVIYQNMDYKSIEKSLNAAKDLNIPIVYLDTDSIAKNESLYIDSLNDKLQRTLDLQTFKDMIVRRENNVYSYARDLPNINDKYFKEDKINRFIDSFYENIFSNFMINEIDKETVFLIYKKIIEILKKENKKRNTKIVDGCLDIAGYVEKAKSYMEKVKQLDILDELNNKKR